MTGPTLAELDWGRGLSPPFGDRSDEHRGAAPSDERLSLDRSLSNGSLVRPGASCGRHCELRNTHTLMFGKAICHVSTIASGACAPPSSPTYPDRRPARSASQRAYSFQEAASADFSQHCRIWVYQPCTRRWFRRGNRRAWPLGCCPDAWAHRARPALLRRHPAPLTFASRNFSPTSSGVCFFPFLSIFLVHSKIGFEPLCRGTDRIGIL